MKYRLMVQEWRQRYDAETKETVEEWFTADESVTNDAKTAGAILRGIAERLDPPKADSRY